MNLKDMVFEAVDWIQLHKERILWRAFVNKAG